MKSLSSSLRENLKESMINNNIAFKKLDRLDNLLGIYESTIGAERFNLIIVDVIKKAVSDYEADRSKNIEKKKVKKVKK
jgi:hypothetical protein